MLRVENLTKIYRSGGEEVVVFEDLGFEVHEGERVALVGESGAGKSTLLHLLGALDTPTRGEVYCVGQPVTTLNAGERARYRNQQVGFIWQMHYLLPEFTTLENVMMPRLIGGGGFERARADAAELLEEVGLKGCEGRRAGELSGGEQQRVTLARALVNRPALLLADEPTGNLDFRTARRVMEVIEELHRTHGLTSVIATHNLELAQRAGRVLRLAGGRLQEVSAPRVV